MDRAVVQTNEAAPATKLFSQGILTSGLVFTTQVGLTPSGQIGSPGVEGQTRQALENVRAVLRAAGGDLRDVVQVTIYLTDLADAPAMNAVYEQFFPQNPPSRACVQVAALAAGLKVEVSAVARVR